MSLLALESESSISLSDESEFKVIRSLITIKGWTMKEYVLENKFMILFVIVENVCAGDIEAKLPQWEHIQDLVEQILAPINWNWIEVE